MKDSAAFGMNKTGVKTAPILTAAMLSEMEEFATGPLDESFEPDDLKARYAAESGTLGSVPAPLTPKGLVKTALQGLSGHHPAVLLDKLGERLAYERSGFRLYEAFINKVRVLLPQHPLGTLGKIKGEEFEHFKMLQEVIEKLGADPTAQTPCADASGVAAMGLMQLVNDPRSTIPQCVEAMVIAEFTDNDAWDLLIQLVESAGLSAEAELFRGAREAEAEHLAYMRGWLRELVLQNGEQSPLQ